ncbi:MAG: response regulator [Anaerolineae bacterium]|nr:response regulator [Anaerolineae bacterium]MDW8173914.1 response regulator [Anaerolineae bacterium]
MPLLQGKRIFYVEDDLRNRAIVQMIVEQHGARLSFERWGKEAVAKMRASLPIDLILLDIMLPNNVNGYDIYAQLRQDSAFDGIPIAIVSASDASLEMTKARQLGLDGYIAKPIDMDLFPRQLAHLIAGEQVWYAG